MNDVHLGIAIKAVTTNPSDRYRSREGFDNNYDLTLSK
jgi:hypothetical protein